jgi:hypothetical protein
VVEVVGPAGAGKSTLMRELRRLRPGLVTDPELRDLAGSRAIHLSAARGLATLVHRRSLVRGAVRDQLEMIAHLEALERAVAGTGDVSYAFDQGPLFYLARPVLGAARMSAWRDERLRRWASLLTLVVLLDAPDEVLAERIDTREKAHALKGAELDAARAALVAARTSFDVLLGRLPPPPVGPRVMRLDTATTDPVALAERLDALL